MTNEATTKIREGQIIRFPRREPMRVAEVKPWVPGIYVCALVGVRTRRFRRITFIDEEIEQLIAEGRLTSEVAHGRPAG